MNELFRLLKIKFKKSFNIIVDAMMHEKYILRDVANRREFRKYAQRILRFVKDAELKDVQIQLNFIYNEINLNLRRDIKRLGVKATVNIFLTNLDELKYK